MTKLGLNPHTLVSLWIGTLVGLICFSSYGHSTSPCSYLLHPPKASELLIQKKLPVSSTLQEVERWKELVQAHPQLSGSLLPLAERAYSRLQIKYKRDKDQQKVNVSVHKIFHPDATSEFSENWAALQTLSRLKRQNLLGDFKLVPVIGRSIRNMTFYLKYVEGVEIYPLFMERNPRGIGFTPVQVVTTSVLDLLTRFDQSIRQVAHLWARHSQLSDQYEMEEYYDDIGGKTFMTYLIVNSRQTGARIFEISMFNTIYDPKLDAFVIFDPY